MSPEVFAISFGRVKPLVKIALIIAICLLGLVLAAHFLGIAFKPRPGGDDAAASFNIGKSETRSSLSSSSTSSSSDNSTFSSRRVLLVAENPHPLSRRIATLLAQKLKDCPQIEQLETTNSPELLAGGTEAPDLFLRLDLVELKEDGILSHAMKATVAASLASAPWQSSNYNQDDTTPPLVHFAWDATLDTETTFSGIRTDRYADAARSIADDLAKAIRKQIEDLSTKFPSLPELPPNFYGPYQPVADFDFLREIKARRAVSYCGLFTHNQTFWQFQTATNPVPQLQHIINQLEATGWKLASASLTNTEAYYIRCRQDDAELEIFRHRADPMSFPPSEQKAVNLEFIAHYRKPFSKAEREAALEKLFAGQPPIETLLPFQHSFSPTQREKFYALVEKSPAASPQGCVQLADVYLSRKQTNAAMTMLLRAKALAATVEDASALESSIEAVAKRISPKKPLKLEVTPETCRDLGFLEITTGSQTIEQERAPGQPLVFFGSGARGVKVYSLTVAPPQKGAYPWTLVQAEAGSRSSSWSSFDLTSGRDWRHSFTFDKQTLNVIAVPAPGKKQVKFTIRVGQ